MDPSSAHRLKRLGRAIDAYLEHRRVADRPDAEFLADHEGLRDLLEPLVDGREVVEEPTGSPRYLGDYRILREVGRGGMGVVYEAEQVSLGRRVALKVLPAHLTLTARQIARFRREAAAAAKLKHPGIVQVHAIGESDGVHYFAMEFVEGKSLAARLAADAESALGVQPGRSRSAAAAELAVQVAEALDAAHTAGIVHRDVKPQNILIGDDGVARLVDFGLAKDLTAEELTQTGDLAGTPHYMSPEQATGRASSVDARSDVFSLGVVLFELLTGKRPFDGDSTHQVLAAIGQREPPSPRRFNSRVPRDLETICLQAIAKRPERRYQTAGALAEDLRRFLDHERIEARPVGPLTRLVDRVLRHKALAASLGLVALVATGALVALSVQSRLHDHEIARSLESSKRAAADLIAIVTGGGVERKAGMRAEYEKGLSRAIGLCEEILSQKHEFDPAFERQVARLLSQSAIFFSTVGELERADTYLERAVQRMRRVTANHPDDPRNQICLASLINNRAMLRRDMKASLRLEDFTEAERLAREVLAMNPPRATEESARSVLAWALTNAANHLTQLDGGLERAERALATAHELWASMENSDVRRNEWIEGWFWTAIGQGTLYSVTGRPAEAERVLRQSLERTDAALTVTPDDLYLRRAKVKTLRWLASMLRRSGQARQAWRTLEKAVPLIEQILAELPRSLTDHLEMVNVRHLQAAIAMEKGIDRPEQARELLAPAAEWLIANESRVQGLLFGDVLALSAFLSRAGDAPDEVAARFERGVAAMRREAADSPHARIVLAGALSNYAQWRLERGEAGLAQRLIDEALACQRSVLQANPRNATARDFLQIHIKLAVRLAEAAGDHVAIDKLAGELADSVPEVSGFAAAAWHHATAVRLARADANLEPAARESAEKRYGDRAMAALRRAVDGGLPAKAKAAIAQSPALLPLHERADFQDLVEAIRTER